MANSQDISKYGIIRERTAFLSFLFGIISSFLQLCRAIYFCCGEPPSFFDILSLPGLVLGLIFGVIGLKSKRKALAKVGIILTLAALILFLLVCLC
jgi:hypothetical protein